MTAQPKTPTPAEQQWIDKAINEIRIASEAEWGANGTCVMVKMNKFDSLGKAGIQEGDEILAINGVALAGVGSFMSILGQLGVGAKPAFRIRRAGNQLDISVELLKKRKLNFDIEEAQVDLERKIAPA
jgi:predicted metalloprotease with PDZ domain